MFREVDFEKIDKTTRYHFLCSAVIPRPIAFVSTIDSATGIKNLAPLSFFNAVASEPPTIMFSVTRRHDGSKKDTLVNIEKEKQFVINHVTLDIFPKVYDASAEMPTEVDEFEVVGLESLPGIKVNAPRVKDSPIHLECELLNTLEVGDGSHGSATIVVGKVLYMHVLDSIYENTGKINMRKITTVSRLSDMGYGLAEHKFDMLKDTWSASNW